MSAIPVPTRNLLLCLLSMAAGCVDALAFLEVGVFPANMTGNSVLLATNLLASASGGAVLSALALIGFCAGAAAGAWTVHSPEQAWTHRVNRALLAAAALVLGATATIYFSGDQHLLPVVLAASAAMGLQSAAVQQLGVPGVATVFMTGTLTTALGRLAGVARERLEGHPRSGPGPWLPAATWLAYFGGAAIGGLPRALSTNLPFAWPGLLILAVSLCSRWRLRRAKKPTT